MLEPTPLLRPSPMELADVFAGTFAVLKQRFGTFAVITLIPVLLLVGAGGWMMLALLDILPVLSHISSGAPLTFDVFASYLGSLIVVAIVQPLVSLKATAMMTLGTYEVGQGKSPTVGSLWRDTRGFMWRIIPLLLVFALVIVVAYVVLVGLIVMMVGTGGDGATAAVAAIGMVVLVLVVLLPLMVYFGVKLAYLVPVITIEKRPNFVALGRAWSLTRGAFWRTLLYYAVAVLVVQAVATIVSSAVQVGLLPAMPTAAQAETLAELQALLASILPAYVIAMAAQGLVQIATTPFQNAYLTVMYLDQRRRTEQPTSVPSVGWAPPPPPPPAWQPPASWQAPPSPPAAPPQSDAFKGPDGFGPGPQG